MKVTIGISLSTEAADTATGQQQIAALKERRPVGASDDPRHPAVKPCERLSERAEWRRARAFWCLPPAPPRSSATPDGAIHQATRRALSKRLSRQTPPLA